MGGMLAFPHHPAEVPKNAKYVGLLSQFADEILFWNQNFRMYQSQRITEDFVHSVSMVVQGCMYGINGDVVFNCF